MFDFFKKLFQAKEAPLSRAEQQRLGDEEILAWEASLNGKSFIFGEFRAAHQRVQNKYPEWRVVTGAGKMHGPAKAEYL